jgi:hypothetical protein
MLGEFFTTFEVMRATKVMVRTQVDHFDDFLGIRRCTFLMFSRNDKSMLDSHHAFTPTPFGDSLLDFKSLLDNGGCQCLHACCVCGTNRVKKRQAWQQHGDWKEPGEGICRHKTVSIQNLRQTLTKKSLVRIALKTISGPIKKGYSRQGVKTDFGD